MPFDFAKFSSIPNASSVQARASMTIDPLLLQAIQRLVLDAQSMAHGNIIGQHPSKRRGNSVTFSSHKLYAPGDDLRHLDWHAFAKTDRFHIKQFEDETNIHLKLWLDHSGSMGFSHQNRPTKLRYATTLAAALGYLALKQGDKVSLTAFGQAITLNTRAHSQAHFFHELVQHLAALSPQGPTQIADVIAQMLKRGSEPSVIVLFSDLFDPDPTLWNTLNALSKQRHDVAVLHILDPTEITLDYDSPVTFESMEDTRRLFIDPRQIRQDYLQQMQTFIRRAQSQLARARIRHQLVTTEQPPEAVLAQFLTRHATR